MTDTELLGVHHQIEMATLIGRTRFDAEMRCVDILASRAAAAEPGIALALLDAAKEIIGIK